MAQWEDEDDALYEEQHKVRCKNPSKCKCYTTATLRKQHLTPPWNTFSIGSFDGMVDNPMDLPCILPSNQCQESWHEVIRKRCQSGLRGSTEKVLSETLPNIVCHDSLNLPDTLLFSTSGYTPGHMIKKALCYLDVASTHIRKPASFIGVFFVLRFKGFYKKITRAVITDYMHALTGDDHLINDKRFTTAEDDITALDALIDICESMHSVSLEIHSCSPGRWPFNKLNPAQLVCSCKGFRMIGAYAVRLPATTAASAMHPPASARIGLHTLAYTLMQLHPTPFPFAFTGLCSHVITVTSEHITDANCVEGTAAYDREHLEHLVEKVSKREKRKSHRPRAALGGTRIQPHGDSASDSDDDSDGEDGQQFNEYLMDI